MVLLFPQCSSRKWKGTPSARIEAPMWNLGRGYPLPSGGRSWRGCAPSPEFFFWFFVWQWCILGACFHVSIRRVKQSRKAILCVNCQLVSYLTWRTYHPWYHTNKHIYQSQQSASQDRHTCSLYYGHSRHTLTCYRLSLYTTFMHFISRDSTPFHFHGKLQLTIGVYRKKQRERPSFPLYKKERERRSRPTRTLRFPDKEKHRSKTAVMGPWRNIAIRFGAEKLEL